MKEYTKNEILSMNFAEFERNITVYEAKQIKKFLNMNIKTFLKTLQDFIIKHNLSDNYKTTIFSFTIYYKEYKEIEELHKKYNMILTTVN